MDRSAVFVTCTVFVPVAAHDPDVTVTPRVAAEVLMEKVIDGVPWPAVIAPWVIVQSYVVPAGPGGTEAVRPVAFGCADDGAVIVALAPEPRVTVCEAVAVQPFAAVT